METGRDYYYDELMSLPIAAAPTAAAPTEVMDAEDPLFLLYTSGTTGKPKAIVHTHGGYQVGVATTLKYAFDLKPEDRWWCAADPGWITGPQLHRLRPADPRRDLGHVRGRARPTRTPTAGGGSSRSTASSSSTRRRPRSAA